MTTLQATTDARRAHRKLKKDGAIPDAPPPEAEWTQASAEELTAALEKAMAESADPKERVRLRRVLADVRGNPNRYKAKPEPTFPTAPTRELQARYGGRLEPEVVIQGSGPVQDLNRHRPRRTLDAYAKHFNERELEVFRRVYDDAEAATTHNLTINYGGSSGGTRPWEKLGGIGNATEAERARYVRFNWILARLPHRIFHQALGWLILEIRSEGMDTLPSIADAGRKWVPTLNHEPTARGVSIGVLKCLAALLDHLYVLDAGMGKASPTASDNRRAG